MAEISRVANAARDGPVVDPFCNQWPRDLEANGRDPVPLPPPTTTFLAPHNTATHPTREMEHDGQQRPA